MRIYDFLNNTENEKNCIEDKTQLMRFVLTDENCIQRYCTNLQFYEKFYIPKCENSNNFSEIVKIYKKKFIILWSFF